MKQRILLLIIVMLSLVFRLYGLNWDQGHHLHPDERFLTMVVGAIKWPSSLSRYLDTDNSPLNPHNVGFGFFVYGTFPLFFVKWVAESINMGNYERLVLTGRIISAFIDVGTVLLVFSIAKTIIHNSNEKDNNFLGRLKISSIQNFPLIAAFFYAISVLPIQLSHFFAVDTFLTFFLTLSFYLLVKLIHNGNKLTTYNLQLTTLLGIAFGLALASKISAVLFLPIIGLGFLYIFLSGNRPIQKKLIYSLILTFVFSASSYFTLRFSYPYLFADSNIISLSLNPKILDNWKQLQAFNNPDSWFPPGVQWIKTTPYIFPLRNNILWGLGLPLGILVLISTGYILKLFFYDIVAFLRKNPKENRLSLKTLIPKHHFLLLLAEAWILFLFLYQGIQFVKALRYFYPIYPFLALITSWFFIYSYSKSKKGYRLGFLAYLSICLIYPLSFMSIYSHLHSRVATSEWIYKHIPRNSTIATEHWDDGLPLSLGPNKISQQYKFVSLPLYDRDSKEKWDKIYPLLKQTDYIALTSNRLYGSIMTVPERYPQTNKYYKSLFDGSLGFEKIAEFTSRPNIPIPFINLCLTPPFTRYGHIAEASQECPLSGISFVDDYADENFTVFDHPKVLIFKKTTEDIPKEFVD